MKRVLILFSMSFEPYQGRYLRAYNEARTLVENGYAVTVLGWDRSGKSLPFEEREGIRIERIHTRAPDTSGMKSLPNFMGFAIQAMARLRKRRFDLIHCHNLQLLPLAICLKRLKRIPLVFDSCEPDYFALYPARLHGMIKYLERRLVKQADGVFVHNDYQRDKYQGMGHSRVSLIGSYPSLDMIPDTPGTIDTPAPSDNGTVVLGRIGSIYRDNGIEEILAGFRLLMKRTDKARLFLAGRVFDAYQETFDRLLEGLEDNVTVLGAFDASDMPRLYSQIDVSIMVYHRSLWFQNITPTKFFDSLALGVPVIVSDMGGLREIIDRYPCGMVVDERDPAAVADAMATMIDQPERRRQMGYQGILAIRESYNWDRMRQKLLTTYGQLLS